ncbi:MAG: hypothetical protein ACOC2W_00640 [bacterium]
MSKGKDLSKETIKNVIDILQKNGYFNVRYDDYFKSFSVPYNIGGPVNIVSDDGKLYVSTTSSHYGLDEIKDYNKQLSNAIKTLEEISEIDPELVA